jgi:uncharacterized delta-60 repeat protein
VGGGLIDFRAGLESFTAIAIEPSSRIVVGSSSYSGFHIARFESDGGVDWDFGSEGITSGPTTEGEVSEASVLLPQPSGALVLGGNVLNSWKYGVISDGVSLLFRPGGSFGETLGEIHGAPGTQIGSAKFSDLLQQEDGSLVAAGSSLSGGGLRAILAGFIPGSNTPFDNSFGGGKGLVRFPEKDFTSESAIGEALVTNAGKLLLAGALNNRVALFRFDHDGIVDVGFGEGGFVSPAIEKSLKAEATAAVVQPDGKVVVAGRTLDVCQVEPVLVGCWNLLIGRFNPDGSLDTTFGHEGFARLATPYADVQTGIDLAILPGGKLLLSNTPGYKGRFVLARYDADGKLDTSFGEGGVAIALPCQGSVAQRRSVGCIASVRAHLRARALSSSRPSMRLRVGENHPLDSIQGVRLLLPPVFRTNPALAGRLRVVAVGGNRAQTKLYAHSINAKRMGTPRAVVFILRRGLLEAVRRISAGHKLVFRVEVKFRDGSTQTVRIARPS